VAPGHDSAPNQFLVAPDAVHVGGIEEGNAAIDRVMNGGDGFGVVGLAIELGHAHAAEALRGHDERTLAQTPIVHMNIVGQTAVRLLPEVNVSSFGRLTGPRYN
jgi:hypothetical protein